jgi:hypothetical protein
MTPDLNAAAANPTTTPSDLARAAMKAAASKVEADHEGLRTYLIDDAFLNRMDSVAEYAAPPRQLRLAGVLKTLMDNRTPASNGTLVALCKSPVFTSVEPRQDLLIRALAEVRPSPPEAVSFWRIHATPKAPYKHVAMNAMADNGSPPAMELFEAMMAEPTHEPENKRAWMRDPILRNRYNPSVLEACERMVTKSLPAPLRGDLVAALFDYREEWYLSCDPATPPDRGTATPEAKAVLRRIGEHALANVPLDVKTKAAVEAQMKWLKP